VCVYIGCHALSKKTIEVVKKTGNDLIVQVQGNQPSLLEAVRSAEIIYPIISIDDQYEHTRNRMTTRYLTVFDAKPALDKLLPDWKDMIACVIRVERTTDSFNTKTNQWNRSHEIAYYLSTHWDNAQELAKAIRGHWEIENREHYVRDVSKRMLVVFARIRGDSLDYVASL